jgi:ParB/RepB/Spo0J family partition protein
MTVTNVPISLIDPPSPALRRFSETEVSFLELVDQMKQHGGPLQVPPARSRPDNRVQIVDGHRRYRACVVAGLETMPLHIKELDDTEYLAAQIACNSQHKETNWVDYARHLDRLRFAKDEAMTIDELATLCKKSETWIRKTLHLKNLHSSIDAMLRRKEVPLGNAQWLSKLPQTEQLKYRDDAQVMPVREFERMVRRAVADYREGVRQGKLEVLGVDNMKPTMRDLKVISDEIKCPTQLPLIIAAAGLTNPVAVAKLALQWAFRVDSVSLEERREKLRSRELQSVNDAERRKYDREQMRIRETD